MKKNRIASTIVIGVITLMSACGKPAPAPETPPVSVVSMTVHPTVLVIAYKGSATLEAADKADVSAEITGRVRDLLADEGDEVRAGALLARLDPSVLASSASEASARLADAQIALDDARQDRERIARLRREGVASQEEMDKGAMRVKRAEEGVAAIRGSSSAATAQLARASIVSPIPGVVTRRWVEIGETASTGKMLFRIEDLTSLKAVLNVPEREVGTIAAGDRVEITVDGGTITGQVTYVSPSADPVARTVKIEALIPNDTGRVRSGVFVEVSVIRAVLPNIIAIPKTALVYRSSGAAALYVIENDVVKRREVQLGASTETLVEIREGLRSGETIVPADVSTLSDGVKVSAKTSASGESSPSPASLPHELPARAPSDTP